MEDTYDLIARHMDDVAKYMAHQMNFDMWYAPSKEEYQLALDLNAGKRLTDMRTRGAKLLKRLKDDAWKAYNSPHL